MTLDLTDTTLLRRDAYVDGAWRSAQSSARFGVTNPATGEILAEMADLEPDDVRAAIDAAHAALPAWRAKTAKERAGLMRKWFELIMATRKISRA